MNLSKVEVWPAGRGLATAAGEPRGNPLPFRPFGDAAEGEEDPSLQLAEVMDRSLHYLLSRVTLGLSPMALAEAYLDWLIHLSLSPGKQLQL